MWHGLDDELNIDKIFLIIVRNNNSYSAVGNNLWITPQWSNDKIIRYNKKIPKIRTATTRKGTSTTTTNITTKKKRKQQQQN